MSKTLKEIEENLEALFILKEGIEEIIISLAHQKKNLKSKALKPILDNLTPESYMSIKDWDNINTETYELLSNWIETFKGFKTSGYSPETGQKVLETAFDQNLPFESQLDILKFIPYIIPWSTYGEVEHVISIFEYTLSERYCYYLKGNKDKTEWHVENHIGHEYFKSKNVQDCLRYIYDHFPYERKTSRKKSTENSF